MKEQNFYKRALDLKHYKIDAIPKDYDIFMRRMNKMIPIGEVIKVATSWELNEDNQVVVHLVHTPMRLDHAVITPLNIIRIDPKDRVEFIKKYGVNNHDSQPSTKEEYWEKYPYSSNKSVEAPQV